MHKKVWIAAGDIILAGLLDYQDDKVDIIFKYMPDEARLLKAYGELPENIRLNEGIRGLNEEDEGGADDYIEGDQKVLDGERKKDFQKMEKVHGRLVNILEGLGLHAGVFSPAEQKQIVDCIYAFQKKGRNSELRVASRTKAKRREVIQIELVGVILEGTAGTQCLAISAPFPFRISTELQGFPNDMRYSSGAGKFSWAEHLQHCPKQNIALRQKGNRAEGPQEIMVVDMRRNAIIFVINVHDAAVGNACGGKDSPCYHSFDYKFQQRGNGIDLFVANYAWRVAMLCPVNQKWLL
ncbi:hypothetical protein ZIOFF_010951 [Zingiber officinale]|uniref:S1-like domain-containing protein n=1 Tax=Zingiber officinale TaxID=94328 RepID=A0A8J5LKB6_ZINOF|nr:hypothetical protein ZIOFF_010951 [Zingiber officinale]